MKDNYIPIETAGVGDLVTVFWKERDVIKSARGRIDKIVSDKYGWKKFVSYSGLEFVQFSMARLKEYQCLIHERNLPEPEPLFSAEWLEKEREK